MNPDLRQRLRDAFGEHVAVHATAQPFEVSLTFKNEEESVPYKVFKTIAEILRTQNISHSYTVKPGCGTCGWGEEVSHKILVREVPSAVYEELFPELT